MRIYQKIAPQASARASLQAGADEDRASLEKMRRLQLRVSGDQAGSRDTEVHKGYHASRGGRAKGQGRRIGVIKAQEDTVPAAVGLLHPCRWSAGLFFSFPAS